VKCAIKSVKEKVDRASRKILINMLINMPINEVVAVGGGADDGDLPLPRLPPTPTRQQAYRDVGFTPRTTNVSLPTSINITQRGCFADSGVL
jgi:hypothetical protein